MDDLLALGIKGVRRKMLEVLLDGLPHDKSQIVACLWDEKGAESNIYAHLTARLQPFSWILESDEPRFPFDSCCHDLCGSTVSAISFPGESRVLDTPRMISQDEKVDF
jgi:hypothetical protein